MHETVLLYAEFKPEFVTSNGTDISPKDSMTYISKYLGNEWFMVGKIILVDDKTLLIRYDHHTLLDSLVAFGTAEDVSSFNNPIQVVDKNGILKNKRIWVILEHTYRNRPILFNSKVPSPHGPCIFCEPTRKQEPGNFRIAESYISAWPLSYWEPSHLEDSWGFGGWAKN